MNCRKGFDSSQIVATTGLCMVCQENKERKDIIDALEIAICQYQGRVNAWIKRTGSITDEKAVEFYKKLAHPVVTEAARSI